MLLLRTTKMYRYRKEIPQFSKEDGEKVMHVSLSILGNMLIMGTDFLESMGHYLKIGNNTTICFDPDSKKETERLFKLLSEDSTEVAPLADQFWGAYWGCCIDKFGVRWMFNYTYKK